VNARGETAGRISLACLAGALGNIVLGGDPSWDQTFVIAAIFWLGHFFAKAPDISAWIEGEHEGRDSVQRRDGD
jgi:hypothetical protein